MDKAITVTADNKARNLRYLKDKAIGQIVKYDPQRFPKVWSTENWTKEYFDRTPEYHEEAEFYEVRVPALQSDEYILQSEIYLDDANPEDIFYTYPVNQYTAQELADMAEEAAEEAAEGEEFSRRADGEALAKSIYRRLRKLNNNGTLTDNQFKAARDLLFDALLPMALYGLFEVTETRLNAIPDPANATLLNILNQIRAEVSNYLITNPLKQA